MNSNAPQTEPSQNATRFGSEGLYDSANVVNSDTDSASDTSSMRVSLGDYLDDSTRESLLETARPSSRRDFYKRNWIPLVAGAAGVALLLTALTRRSMRG